MTPDDLDQMVRLWEQPGSLYAPEGEDDADTEAGTSALPGLSMAEILNRE